MLHHRCTLVEGTGGPLLIFLILSQKTRATRKCQCSKTFDFLDLMSYYSLDFRACVQPLDSLDLMSSTYYFQSLCPSIELELMSYPCIFQNLCLTIVLELMSQFKLFRTYVLPRNQILCLTLKVVRSCVLLKNQSQCPTLKFFRTKGYTIGLELMSYPQIRANVPLPP